jgi:3-oxoacyl-[acyl-carrier-protein] synthase II
MSAAIVIRSAGAAPEAALEALPTAVQARATRAERITQLVLAAGGSALDRAGLAATEGPARPELGVVIGTAFGCALTNAAYAARLVDGGPAAASPRLFAATVSNAAAGELSIAYRLGGPCVTLTAGAAAGLAALAHAVDMLRAGRATGLVAGGVDAFGDQLGMADAGLCAPADGAALFVLDAGGGGARLGAILGCALGFGAASVDAVVGDALAEAGVAHADVDRVAGGGAPTAAGAPLALATALAAARPGSLLVVVEACPSGHVAALVARAGAAA